MPFDPAAYLADKKGKSSGFSPESYLKEKTGASPEAASAPVAEAPGELESFARGAANGASFGFAPAITGAIGTLPKVGDALDGNASLKDILEAYSKARDASKAQYDTAASTNPKSSIAGSLLGGLAPALLTGGSSEAATLGSAALTGAKIGAATGLGDSVSSGDGLLSTAGNVAKGGALGGVLGSALHGAGSLFNGGAADSLESLANERAMKATGIGKPQLKNLFKTDLKQNAYNVGAAATEGAEPEIQNTVQKMGDLLVSKNPYQESPVVTTLSTPETILERTSDLADKSGQHIADVLKEMDATYSAENPTAIIKFPKPQEIASEVQKQLLDPLKVGGNIPPISEGAASKVQQIIDTVNQYGSNPIPFEKAQELKTLVTGLANYEADGSANNQMLKRAGGIINKHIEDSADDVVNAAGKPELFDQYKQAKDYYKAAKTAQNASMGKSAGNMVNRDFGITDYLSADALAHAGGPIAGFVGMGANKLAKTYGNSALAVGSKVLAKGAQALSDNVGDTGRYLSTIPKEAIASYGRTLAASADPLSQKLGNVLAGAAERDDIGRNALVFSLMQNSAYRQLLNNQFGNSQEGKK